jgi:endonuclease YncB( thermonuclease family)
MRLTFIAVSFFVAVSTTSWSATVTVRESDTLVLDGTVFRLDGIDAPEPDQVCLDTTGAVWPCGVTAREQLKSWIGERAVRCDDKGPDTAYGERRIGICWVEGETASLNQWLVQQGWALNFEPYARGRFRADEASARDSRRGLWKGCFSSPQHYRRWEKTKADLLGPACATDNARDLLFPDHPAMPPGCPIKGTRHWSAWPYDGIYHLEHCGSYRHMTKPHRWFCSEDGAWAAGFRRAISCWPWPPHYPPRP